MASQDDIVRKMAEIASNVRNPTYQNPPPVVSNAPPPQGATFEALQRAMGAKPTGEVLGRFNPIDPTIGLAKFMPSGYSVTGGRDVISPPSAPAAKMQPYARDTLAEARNAGLMNQLTPEQGQAWTKDLTRLRGSEAIDRSLANVQQQALGNRQLPPGSNLPAVGPQDFVLRGGPRTGTPTYTGPANFGLPTAPPSTVQGEFAGAPRQAGSAGPTMGDQMGRGYVPKGFWEGIGERINQPNPGAPQGINLNDKDFRVAEGLAKVIGGMRSGRGLGVASGIGTLAGVGKEIWDERNARLAEQARPYTLGATLEAAGAGNAQRTVAEDAARRVGPMGLALEQARGAPITFPQAMAQEGVGRVTPGAPSGISPAAPNQQRGELDLTGMSFKDAFKFARQQAAAEGVDATGRFIWNGNAYQTNVNPARGGERYVPESRQTRLGNLPEAPTAFSPAPAAQVEYQSAKQAPTLLPTMAEAIKTTPEQPAATKKDILESLPDYEARRKAAQGYIGSRIAAGEGTLEKPIMIGGAELAPGTARYLEQHPEHRYASTNPNLQREYVQLMKQRDELGITAKEMEESKQESQRVRETGGTVRGSVPQFRYGKYGQTVSGGLFYAPSSKSRSEQKGETQQRTETQDEKSKFLERFADWNRRNEEWSAREATAKRGETYRSNLETLSNRMTALEEIIGDPNKSADQRANAQRTLDQLTGQYTRAKDLKP